MKNCRTDELVASKEAEPDHEDVRPGPAGQPGRLGVQEQDRLAIDGQRLRRSRQAAEPPVGQIEEAPERLVAVVMIQREDALGDEAGAKRPFDDGARHQMLDLPVPPSPRARGGGWRAGPTPGRPEHPPQALAQVDGHCEAASSAIGRVWRPECAPPRSWQRRGA